MLTFNYAVHHGQLNIMYYACKTLFTTYCSCYVGSWCSQKVNFQPMHKITEQPPLSFLQCSAKYMTQYMHEFNGKYKMWKMWCWLSYQSRQCYCNSWKNPYCASLVSIRKTPTKSQNYSLLQLSGLADKSAWSQKIWCTLTSKQSPSINALITKVP